MLDRILNIRKKPDSKTIAKNRLRLILIQDRTLVEPNPKKEASESNGNFRIFGSSDLNMETHFAQKRDCFAEFIPSIGIRNDNPCLATKESH